METDLTPLQAMVWQEVERAALRGRPCPTNAEIAEKTGSFDSSISSCFYALQRKGLIRITHFGKAHSHLRRRQVTLVSTGQATALPETAGLNLNPRRATVPAAPCFNCGCRMDACECGRGR